jgi:outer membrane lipoprotein SlyB
MILGLTAATMTLPALPAVAVAQHHYSGQTWRGEDGRIYCRRSNGTTGLLVGGAVGALAGRAIDTQGSRTTGTILGAAAGALLGRELQRGRSARRCR